MKAGKLDAVICLGCIIQGETRHDEYIAQAVSNGTMQLGLATGIPVIFGVLTTRDADQAAQRAGGKHGNKGSEAAMTALRMAAICLVFYLCRGYFTGGWPPWETLLAFAASLVMGFVNWN